MEAGYFFSCLVQDRASFVLIEVMTIDWNGLSGLRIPEEEVFLALALQLKSVPFQIRPRSPDVVLLLLRPCQTLKYTKLHKRKRFEQICVNSYTIRLPIMRIKEM